MTVGRIGELTGLTTGATTRLVDRLEQAGFVRRVADPADRRRVDRRAGGRPGDGRRARPSTRSSSPAARRSSRWTT